ncbi:hypothetical protein GSI_07090 [Ganoderma sinense ZZ0214-1]|uniref:Uncharacterized protein n=1 Tax=Ganoderma sinense ZZ0214-1 TaxID=1077348 RepID=A0A2G8SAZ1_9APHY|nr:hypothetical protein GSI_07090 [Ganoderma sinense ZZ0214-1]
MRWEGRGVRRTGRSSPRRRRICRLLGRGQDSIGYGALGLGLRCSAIVACVVACLCRRLGRRAPRVRVPAVVLGLSRGTILSIGVVRRRSGLRGSGAVRGGGVVTGALCGCRVRPIPSVL